MSIGSERGSTVLQLNFSQIQLYPVISRAKNETRNVHYQKHSKINATRDTMASDEIA